MKYLYSNWWILLVFFWKFSPGDYRHERVKRMDPMQGKGEYSIRRIEKAQGKYFPWKGPRFQGRTQTFDFGQSQIWFDILKAHVLCTYYTSDADLNMEVQSVQLNTMGDFGLFLPSSENGLHSTHLERPGRIYPFVAYSNRETLFLECWLFKS